jgi:hypothetical protein
MSNLFQDLVNEYLQLTDPCHGQIARPTDIFYATTLVSESLHFIRNQILNGKNLTAKGERFVAGAAAYLALLAYSSYSKHSSGTE